MKELEDGALLHTKLFMAEQLSLSASEKSFAMPHPRTVTLAEGNTRLRAPKRLLIVAVLVLAELRLSRVLKEKTTASTEGKVWVMELRTLLKLESLPLLREKTVVSGCLNSPRLESPKMTNLDPVCGEKSIGRLD